MASEFHFYGDMFGQLNNALTTYVSSVATNVISGITPVATTLLLIYVMLWGWTTIRGMISEPITDGITRIVRLSVIYAIAITLGTYNKYISDFLWNSPDALSSLIASGYSDSISNANFLDQLIGKIFDLGKSYWEKANATTSMMPDLGLLATALIIWIAGLAATAYGAFLLALSKMALAILLGIGPIFVLLLIFEGTKRFFESWLGQALNYVFLVVLTASAIKIIFTILDKYLDANVPNMTDPSVQGALPAIGICLIAALVMMQLSSISSALGGGAAIGTLGAATWVYGKATGTATALRPTNLRRSTNKARSDVIIASRAVKTAATAPHAVYRKITRPRSARAEKTK